MQRLCQFQDAFGKPRQGLHRWRIPVLDWALVDTALTIIAAWLLAKWTGASFVLVLAALLLVGVLAHWLFCVDTQSLRAPQARSTKSAICL